MTGQSASAPEFSRPVDISRIGSAAMVHEIGATPEERAALARRFGLLGLDRLEARVRLRRAQHGTALYLDGHLTADVTQECVVTLAPIANHIEADFSVVYGDVPDTGDVSIETGDEGTLEPLPAGPLDIGEAVAQELSLALDPYPRAPGAALESGPAGDSTPPGRINPFSALAKLPKTGR